MIVLNIVTVSLVRLRDIFDPKGGQLAVKVVMVGSVLFLLALLSLDHEPPDGGLGVVEALSVEVGVDPSVV